MGNRFLETDALSNWTFKQYLPASENDLHDVMTQIFGWARSSLLLMTVSHRKCSFNQTNTMQFFSSSTMHQIFFTYNYLVTACILDLTLQHSFKVWSRVNQAVQYFDKHGWMPTESMLGLPQILSSLLL